MQTNQIMHANMNISKTEKIKLRRYDTSQWKTDR